MGEEISFWLAFSLHQLEGSASAATPLEKPYLRTKSILTIGHLRKYIGRKMGLPADMPIEFYCSERALEAGLTLAQILRTHWAEDRDLVLHYRLG